MRAPIVPIGTLWLGRINEGNLPRQRESVRQERARSGGDTWERCPSGKQVEGWRHLDNVQPISTVEALRRLLNPIIALGYKVESLSIVLAS